MCCVDSIGCSSYIVFYIIFFFEWCGDHRDLHVLTHSFPTRRSSDLRLVIYRRESRFQIIELHYLEARQQRLEAIAHLGLIGCRDGAQRPAMKSVGEGYEFLLLRIAIGIMIAARRLDGAFPRPRSALGEEPRVGKGVHNQPARKNGGEGKKRA